MGGNCWSDMMTTISTRFSISKPRRLLRLLIIRRRLRLPLALFLMLLPLLAVASMIVSPQDALALLDSVDTVNREFVPPSATPKEELATIGNSENSQTVGLVLSGGGAKGIAHVGVIKALEDHDIPIDYVTGTSMGAIVGSLYSCGWSPGEMLSFFTSKDFNYWATGELNPSLVYFFSRPRPTPSWVNLHVSFTKKNNFSEQIIPGSLVSPLPMNIEFLRLYTPYSAQCGEDFSNLFVPFRCVCSDIYHKHKVVLSRGSLGDAVRASMSFPLVFRPIEIDGLLMFDGGIYDNFPVDVMQQDFHPDFIIGVSVSAPDGKPEPGNPYSQLEDMIIQNNDYNVPSENGVKIQVPVLNFGVLDFQSAEEIYAIGYKAGLSMVDSISRRIEARRSLNEVTRRRDAFASKTPAVEFDSISISGTTLGQTRFLRYLFRRGKETPFDMAQTYDAYYRAVAGGKMTNLMPQAHLNLQRDSEQIAACLSAGEPPLCTSNSLSLQAEVKSPWKIGVGGWITSSTNSFLYIGLGYHTLSFNSLDVDLAAWVGQSYDALSLSAMFTLNSLRPAYLQLEGVLSRQKFYDSKLLFYDSAPSFITDSQHFLRLNYCMALGREGKASASIGWGRLQDRYYPIEQKRIVMGGERMQTDYHILVGRLSGERNTLNNELYPSAGRRLKFDAIASRENVASAPQHAAERRYHDRYRLRMIADWTHYFPLHDQFSLGAHLEGVATISPLAHDYTAGMIHAENFAPTPSMKNYFNPAFRADNFAAVGVVPVWQPISHLQIRGDFNLFQPFRQLEQKADFSPCRGPLWGTPRFAGEIAGVYNFKFASLSLYADYLSAPARNWNFGINFGLYFQAPHLVR